MSKMHLRLFFGSYINPDKILCKQEMESLQSQFDFPLKLVASEKIHLTWKFLGNVEESRLEDLRCCLKKIVQDIQPLFFEFNKVSIWPSYKKPGVLVLEARDINGNSVELYKKLTLSLENTGIKIDKKPFKPHVTIVRFKRTDKCQKPIDICIKPKQIKIDNIHLIQSQTLSTGSVYKNLCSFNLE